MKAGNTMRWLPIVTIAAISCAEGVQDAPADGVPARLAREHPCPPAPPANWTAADPSLGQGTRCVLVATGASAVAAAKAQDARLRAIDLARAHCVRLERITVQTPSRDSVVADGWLVVFHYDTQPDVAVAIQARTGEAGAFLSPRDDGSSAAESCARAT